MSRTIAKTRAGRLTPHLHDPPPPLQKGRGRIPDLDGSHHDPVGELQLRDDLGLRAEQRLDVVAPRDRGGRVPEQVPDPAVVDPDLREQASPLEAESAE